MLVFQTRPVLLDYGIAEKFISKQLREYTKIKNGEIKDTEEAIGVLSEVINGIQEKLTNRILKENTYDSLLKLLWIFDEIHSRYLKEKEARVKISQKRFFNEELTSIFAENRNVMRYVIDACNVWIENCVLLQHDVDIKSIDIKKMFVLDRALLSDLLLYGIASHTMSLLMLSRNKDMKCPYYGINVDTEKIIPIEPIKYHPYIYYDTVITGNQNILSPIPLTADANDTDFGKGFKKETDIEFLLFLATVYAFQANELNSDDKSLRIISKKEFISIVEHSTNPAISGSVFFDNFVLSKEKLQKHLRKDECIIWVMGANKYRLELRPFICLDDENIIVPYGTLEQAKQLWVSYQSNGGMCYTHPAKMDSIKESLDRKNTELSNVLLQRIRETLLANYTNPTVNLVDVRYDRIFGEKEIDYGDYDVIFFSSEAKELFLIEAKYFSDSLNASGIVTDYEKMYQANGYYDHCRHRYELVIKEKEKLKEFLGIEDSVKLHMLFVSSKPLEMDLKDEDEMVTILPLDLLDMYLHGKLLDGETGNVVQTKWVI